MSRDVCIHTWPCTYYLEPERRWVTGQLSLTSLSLRFMTDSTGETLVSFPLSSIVEIKKEASHFIFSSITVLEKGHTKHWFSSLRPSRNVVFSIIEHFWRELLLSQPAADTPAPRTRGKELTGLMAGSQKRLEDTARVLHHQGQQLDGVMRGLDKMESDLEVADRLLTELESPVWWPFGSKLWKTPSETKAREGVSVKPSCEPLGKEGMLIQIPAIISHRTESHVKPGRLTVLVSGLEIYDSSSLLMHRFEREDVDDIKVHSPYEISIRQRFIGKPDMAYRLISAKMPEAIPILEVQFSKKMELLEDALVLRSVRTSSPAEKSRSVWHAGETSDELQEVQLPLIPQTWCRLLYGHISYIMPDMLCAGDILNIKTVCEGDSGGPLVCEFNRSWLQVGIVSWGRGCSNPLYPGVYASVSYFSKWIRYNIEITPAPAQPAPAFCPALGATLSVLVAMLVGWSVL
uniref:Synaptosomal-associated protein 47 n=1 Tax=Callithrix jacchus TaxID=9483 RepID=A0A5F4W9C2_CALJA